MIASSSTALRVAPRAAFRALSTSNSARWEAWCQQPVMAALDAACAPMSTAEFWRTTGSKSLIAPEASALDAAKQMSALRLSYLLVTDSGAADGRVLGMATERMFLRWALNHDFSGPDDARTTPVPALLAHTSELLCARPTDSVGACLRLMGERIFRHLPVVELDADGNATRCRGIVKLRDLMRPIALEIAETTLPATFRVSPLKKLALAPPPPGDAAGPPAYRDVWGERTVGDVLAEKRAARGVTGKKAAFAYMQERATMHTVRVDASVGEALRKIEAHNLTFLVVVDAEWQVQGILTERNFVHAVATEANSIADGVRPGPTPSVLAKPVSAVMEQMHALPCVRTADRATDCMALMISMNVRHLPILADKDSLLAGIVSARDLIAPLIPGWEDDDSRRSFLGQIADSHNLEDTPMGVS